MATFINNAAQNFSANWSETDASTLQTTVSSSTNTTTSMVYTAALAGSGVVNIDGVALHLKRLGTTGTFSVTLNQNGVGDQQTVTVNCSDIPDNLTWMFFKFASPVAIDTDVEWRIGVTSSTNAMVQVNRDGTAANWARILRRTTQGAIANTDNVYIMGEWTAAATTTARTVTMDLTTAVNTTDVNVVTVGQGGSLVYGLSASTAYHLGIGASSKVWPGGTLTIGTTGGRMPATSTGILELAANSVTLIIDNDATFTAAGQTLTVVKTLLAADAAASATSLTTADSTGWLNGDQIALATTTGTASQCEDKLLTAGASGTTLTIAAITNAHSGTSPTQGELINLTRNVKIQGASTTATGNSITIRDGATSTLSYVEIKHVASTLSYSTSGTGAGTTHSLIGCSIHSSTAASSRALDVNVTGSGKTLTITDLVSYNFASIQATFYPPGSATLAVNGLYCVRTTGSASVIEINGPTTSSHSFSNILATGGGAAGIRIGSNTTAGNLDGTFSTLTSHGNTSSGLLVGLTFQTHNLTISNLTVWRTVIGLSMSGSPINNNVTLNTLTAFGNTTAGVQVSGPIIGLTVNNGTFNAGVTTTQPIGINVPAAGGISECYLNSCSFGATTTHATGDLVFAAGSMIGSVYMNNCTLASSTEISNSQNSNGYFVGMTNYDGTANTHKSLRRAGTIQNDASVYNTAAPSEKLTPSSASLKLESGTKAMDVNASTTYTISVSVRKDAAYNGNQPRLRQRANIGGGIASDVTIDTMSVAVGNWEVLTGTTTALNYNGVAEFYVDCDGTAGYINVDDWSPTA